MFSESSKQPKCLNLTTLFLLIILKMMVVLVWDAYVTSGAMASLGQQALFSPHLSGPQSKTSYESLQQSIILTVTLFLATWEYTPVSSNALSAENWEPFLCNKELPLTEKYAPPSCGRKLTTLNLIQAIIFTSSNKTSHLVFPSHLYWFKCVEETKLERRHHRL